MSTYADRLAPYQNFKDKHEMDEHVTKHLQHIGYELNNTDHKLLNHIRTHAVRYPGAFQQLTETMAKAIDKSVPTVKRILTKLVKLGILKRKLTRKKNNSRMGASIYQIQIFSLENDTQKMIRSNKKEDLSNSCGSKVQTNGNENKPFISLNKNNLKDITNPEDGTASNSLVLETSEKPVSLRQKIARQLKARNLSLTTLNEFATIAYGQIKKLMKQDTSIPKAYVEELVYKKFLFILDRKGTTNPFGLFTHVIKKEFAKLLGKNPEGEQCELELQAKRGVRFRPVPDWMIEQEQDPTRKARLIKNNEIARKQREQATAGKKVGVVTEWYRDLKAQEAQEEAEKAAARKAEIENAPQINFEEARLKLLEELNN